MSARRTKKQKLQREIEKEIWIDTVDVDGSGYEDTYENWANYQEYLKAQSKKAYERALIAAYETHELDPDSFDWASL